MSNFVKQVSFEVEAVPTDITKYVSQKTGLQMILIKQQRPLIEGYFAVATEIDNDSGSAHTLEHIVFSGSKKHPQNGFFETLANRSFSSSNAFTWVDQTVFTLSSGGWEGFRNVLPVYLDHILYPTIRDDVCLTEVYHIDGDGKEKGVVFSEMRGLVANVGFINHLAVRRMLFKEGSPYRSEIGGLVENLRTLTWSEIRDFHESMYRPDNLCLVIAGSIDEQDLLNVMQEFDESLPSLPSSPNKRPFSDAVMAPLSAPIIQKVEFPDLDESKGEILMCWVGPSFEETLDILALDVLGSLFTKSTLALFTKNLVEIDNPVATEISYYNERFKNTLLSLNICGVPVDKLEEVDSTVKRLLKEQTQPENFDLNMVRVVLRQAKLLQLSSIEESPSNLCVLAIREFIDGNSDGQDLVPLVNNLKEYDIMEKWEAKEWCEVIQKWFVNNSPASALGTPSAKLYESKKEADKAIEDGIKERYGEEGLAKMGIRLKEAQKKNDYKLEEELFNSFPRPDPAKIPFIKTRSYKAGSNVDDHESYINDDSFALRLIDDFPGDIPLYFHIEDFKSQFLTIHLLASSFNVPIELKPYLSIMKILFSSGIELPSGEFIPKEKVIAALKTDLIHYEIRRSFQREFYEFMDLSFKLEAKNYSKAIDWYGKLINFSKFSESTVKSAIEKLINMIPEIKRDGYQMMSSLSTRTLLDSRSLKCAADTIKNREFFLSCLRKIEDGGFDEICNDLYEVRRYFFATNNLRILLVGDVSRIPNPISPWSGFLETYQNITTSPLTSIPFSFQVLSGKGKNVKNEAFLTSYSASNAAFLSTYTTIPTDYSHYDIQKISVVSMLLTATDGPFWKGIRGAGLAYGNFVVVSTENGTLNFILYRATDAVEAFKIAKKIVDEYAEGDKLTKDEVDDAISLAVNQLVQNQSSYVDAATSKFKDNILKERGPDFNTKYLKQLTSITVEEIKEVFKKYYQPLFDSNSSMVFGCLHPNDTDSVKTFLEGNGYNVTLEADAANEGVADD